MIVLIFLGALLQLLGANSLCSRAELTRPITGL